MGGLFGLIMVGVLFYTAFMLLSGVKESRADRANGGSGAVVSPVLRHLVGYALVFPAVAGIFYLTVGLFLREVGSAYRYGPKPTSYTGLAVLGIFFSIMMIPVINAMLRGTEKRRPLP